MTEFEEGVKVFMATANGTVKKTVLTEFNRLRTAGKVAIKLVEGDELIGVDLTSGEKTKVMLFSAEGKSGALLKSLLSVRWAATPPVFAVFV